MDSGTINSVVVLLAALVGAVSGFAGSLVAARITGRTERRRVAVEVGLREWESASDHARTTGGQIFPPALFAYYNIELFRLIDENRLTAKNYSELASRRDQFRNAIKADSSRREQDLKGRS